jgi:cyanophycin synthetase
MPAQIRDSRRQTGAGRLLDGPGAALEADISEDLAAAAAAAWQQRVRALSAAVGWPEPETAVRPFPGGLSLGVSAPLDGLNAATVLNEAAWETAWAEASGEPAPSLDDAVDLVRAALDRDLDPALVALEGAARAHGVSLLWDDELVTLGLGAGSRTWPADALPAPEDVDWGAVSDLPVAVVTGTNGKSTTVRMLAAMATAAGLVPGVSTTDYVAVGGETLETGDFSGPMGARAALRDRRATVGILEVARGGLLRRGVPVSRASVACVTNVAADHLGEYGVETVEALAEAKFVVAKALSPGGLLVLSADDARSCAEADRQAGALAARGVAVCWAGLDPDHPRLAGAEVAASVVDGQIAVRRGDGAWTPLVPVAEAPATMGGAALHNVRNAVSAVATGAALRLPDDALAAGLRAFRGDATDNPGRANVALVNGATVVVDYAHNVHGLAALVHFAGHLPARRRLILLSSAGDRPDSDVREMVRVARTFAPDRTLAADLPDYLRGRAPREVSALIEAASVAEGAGPDAVATFPDPAAAARDALAWARPGDVLLLVVLSHRAEVAALVEAARAPA